MIYDSIVIGAGHAGVEAALILAKKHNTLLITGSLKQVASLPCNPSIGGPAKGVVVREIDALGGVMAKAADLAQIQIKMLNSSKGPAVRALRAQIDKLEYPQIILEILQKKLNLTLLEGLVNNLVIQNNQVQGVCLIDGTKINAKTVIITTGTYLASQILIGDTKKSSGPNGVPTTYGISTQLKELGFEVIRLKTGTPPRVKKKSIDYSQTKIQMGDNLEQIFSFVPQTNQRPQEPCFLTHTNQTTHQVIQKHLNQSAMYGGYVEGTGPRYCPSIEDKVVRFCDKNSHQIFIEPESLSLDEMYLQGLSTSMPQHVQHEILKTIPGLQNAQITKYAYAIEYDAFNPNQLKHSLETKKIQNLFLAGQMNGTSGYEEAACQGLMAGINASLKLQNKPPFVLKRNEAYIGVLIDDLITKGAKEPYRLLTSRAEFRLLLRHDNADLRLKDYGYQLGLIDEKDYNNFQNKKAKIKLLLEKSKNYEILVNSDNLSYLKQQNSASLGEKTTLAQLLKRPELNFCTLQHFLQEKADKTIYEQVEIQIKYEGYIAKAQKEAQKLARLEQKKIPSKINYADIKNLSKEAQEKLDLIKPQTLGQATRILGVNQVDISILLVYLEKHHALL
ncbi:tRNA uridine-5-carboxymethylaminomethyl(34) synthesis enzyme MnmG ['Catharanthus roseus' aster yellows phytoplasma]|uniref:tRNA uridine 5-carboxymethylaminomethyl modification enzyme MnmG n=1 Tax='Catharanthus roseus' aster yellows phytoplasma TaxID=1193712 RepID=A0A4P6M915_9MOLU|nr:tRNA uridine-5-carboxymethylaminomethyl(34) synthesis enzyme MnmG ['Catharanthus roseus' aster yellows phytoplasma]QBF23889.1 tRNA uridine-5-carboxymethylaminomethyl(34) synthesis enzyme MnmG ['Catharanthus roseus' aster yellows phytoplasma]